MGFNNEFQIGQKTSNVPILLNFRFLFLTLLTLKYFPFHHTTRVRCAIFQDKVILLLSFVSYPSQPLRVNSLRNYTLLHVIHAAVFHI